MAHLLYMDLFRGDWADRKKEGTECWTCALFYDPFETLKKKLVVKSYTRSSC